MRAFAAPMASPPQERVRGFTLVELLFALAIVALLLALAYPSYLDQVRKSRRAEAKTALLELAARQERFSTVNAKWATTPAQLGYGETDFPIVLSPSYSLSITVDSSVGAYTATAKATGRQVADACGNFVLNHQGVQTSSWTPNGGCW